jgi:hypothetical protein
MADPTLSIWPISNDRKVIRAEAQMVDERQRLFRVAFADSAKKQLAVQLTENTLRNLIETGASLLNIKLQLSEREL